MLNAHLPQGSHNEKDHSSADQIAHHDGGPRLLDRFSRAIEQARSDHPAQGDKLNVPVLQPPLKSLLLLRSTRRSGSRRTEA